MSCESVATADKQLGMRGRLAQMLAKNAKASQAWQRGRFLLNIKQLASIAVTLPEAAKKIGMTSAELRDLIRTDTEVCDIWQQARHAAFIRIKAAFLKQALDGNQSAIKAVERFLDEERTSEKAEASLSSLTSTQIANLLGRSRAVIYNWVKDGLPRNQDKTFDLRAVLAWYEEFSVQKAKPDAKIDTSRIKASQMIELFGVTKSTFFDWYSTKGLPQNPDGTFDLQKAIIWREEFLLAKAVRAKDSISLNPFQAVKTERERLRLEQERAELVERGAVIGFQIAIVQNVLSAFANIPDLANRVFGQSREEIVLRFEEFRDELVSKMQSVPPILKLDEKASTKLAELFDLIKPSTK